MFACWSETEILASSMNIDTNSSLSLRCDRMRLMTWIFSKPAVEKLLALKISAIPPVAIRSTR